MLPLLLIQLSNQVPGTIVQRRPTDNPSGVGTRSSDTRMGGL
jgi:hypothetical protein